MSTISYYNTGQDLLAIGVDELTRLATNRLGGLEGVEYYGKRFDGAVVVNVVSCVDHSNSDHLHVCMIDDGGVVEGVDRDTNGHIQVVCGAPNVEAGQTVVWLPPGATVPSSRDEAEPFVLSKREIRGVISNGMLASPSELGLFENHDGILVIQEAEVGAELMKPGTEFKKLYGLDDVLFEFENKMFTHRPDCFGQIGLARELSAIQGLKYTSPDWYWKHPRKLDIRKTQDINIINDAYNVVPRLMAVAMSGVTVGESPIWLKSFITRMGGKPVNNVVDISNYIMHITGQPTHAYDLRKISGAQIRARMATEGEKIALLNGKTVKLTEDDIVIADAEKAVGIAGIMGGCETEVDESTTDILLEVASFDMYTIRKTAMRNGLFTDAFTRFSKGQSPLQNDRVMDKFISMLSEICGATPSSEVIDLKSEHVQQMDDFGHIHAPVRTTPEFINSRLGTSLSGDEIKELLRNVEMAILDVDDELEIYAPFFRTDIQIPEDIVEEVGRLYGFDRLELQLPMRTTAPANRNDMLVLKQTIRDTLTAIGANEQLSYSFVHGDVLKKSGVQNPDDWAFHIRNAISPDLQYYRTSLIPSLLTKIHPNIKSDMVRSDDNEFAMFELGKVHIKKHLDEEGLPQEFERLAFVYTADEKTSSRNHSGSPYYLAKKYLQSLLGEQATFEPLDTNEYPITSPYQIGRSATVKIRGEVMGVIGEFRASVKKSFKLPEFTAGFELDTSLLMRLLIGSAYQPISTYPKTQQDITLRVPADVTYGDLYQTMWDALQKTSADKGYETVIGPRDIFQKNGEGTKNMTFRLWVWHPDKTLMTEEVNELLNELTNIASDAYNAERV